MKPAIVYDNADKMIAWAAERIGGLSFRDDARAVGLMRDELCAVVVYDGFSQCDCNMHIASDGSRHWLTRAFLQTAFAHPFIQWNLRRVTGLVPASNAQALRFDLKLGFQVEGHCRHGLPKDDVIILGMLREACPYIPKEYRHA